MKKLLLSIALMGMLTSLTNLIEGCGDCTLCAIGDTIPLTFCNNFSITATPNTPIKTCNPNVGSIEVKICNTTTTTCTLNIGLFLNGQSVDAAGPIDLPGGSVNNLNELWKRLQFRMKSHSM